MWTPADIVPEMITVAQNTGGATYAELLDDTSLSKVGQLDRTEGRRYGIVADLSHSFSAVRASTQATLVEALNAVTSQLRRRLRTAFPAASDSDIAWCLTELQRQAARAALLRQRRQDGAAPGDCAAGPTG